MRYIYSLLLFCCLLFAASVQLHAQTVIGAKTETNLSPDQDAVLDLRSGGNKGLLLPRLKLTNLYSPDPLSKHTAGMVVYNLGGEGVPEGYYFNDGLRWIQIVDTHVYSWYSTATKRGAESNADDIYQGGGVVIGDTDIEPHTKFMVASGDKGALLPNLTSAQIENITNTLSNEEKEKIDGLMVYNQSTGCFSFFNGETFEWRSLCADTAPAGMFVECESDCRAYGNYKAQVTLTSDNFYRIRIRVNEPGAYDVRIATENGYSFSKSGTFNEIGVYIIDVPGQGVPEQGGTDKVTIYLNEVEVEAESVTVENIIVADASASYAIICQGATPGALIGEYEAKEEVDGETHNIEIEIEVRSGAGEEVVIETGVVNGIEFKSDPVILGAVGTTQTVTLMAYGTPQKIGRFPYTPTYVSGDPCPFFVDVTTQLGTFERPAKTCLEMYNIDVKADGEYWVAPQGTNKYKTYCDMTHGGYTLVFSFSELTAYGRESFYAPAGMAMDENHQLSRDLPRNTVTTEGGTIKYEDFRLPLAAMQNLKAGATSDLRVRIAYLPTVMNDLWGELNYIEFKAKTATNDPVFNRFNTGVMPTIASVFRGKVFGLDLSMNTSRVIYDGYTLPIEGFRMYTSSYSATHWDVGLASFSAIGSRTVTLPKHPDDGGTFQFTFAPNSFNNMFGWWDETEINQHFGKCGTGTNDVANYTASGTCGGGSGSSDLHPHTFNNGQGRYLQWWIK